MNERPDDLDRILDETLATMVEGEPRRVSGASVRRAAGKRSGFAIPMWLAAAAVLIVGVIVASKSRAPVQEAPARVARALPSSSPNEPGPAPSPAAEKPADHSPVRTNMRVARATTTEPAYEGLPRLTIQSIDAPEPLTTAGLAGNQPIQLQRIEITPLSISTLSNENHQEHQP